MTGVLWRAGYGGYIAPFISYRHSAKGIEHAGAVPMVVALADGGCSCRWWLLRPLFDDDRIEGECEPEQQSYTSNMQRRIRDLP